MGKRLLWGLVALWLAAAPALAELTVERREGEAYFPSEQKWTYHFTYAYPHIVGEDYTAALINDTYQMALDEMTQLVLPMFANSRDMRFDGQNRVTHDFSVLCNNGRLLCVLQTRLQTMGQEGSQYTLEPLTFDVGGMYAGETLTLRGVTLIQAGVDAERLEDVEPEEYPQIAAIIDGSSTEMAEALLPVLYERFFREENRDLLKADITLEDFEAEFSPARDFGADGEGNLLFFLPPMLLQTPGWDVPVEKMPPEEIEAVLLHAQSGTLGESVEGGE